MSKQMSDIVSHAVTPEPASKPKPDWIKAQVLYIQGQPHPVICKECNVSLAALRKRAERKEWTPIRRTVIKQTETITRTAATHAADSVRPALARHLKELADSEPLKRPSRSIAHADAKSNVVLKLAQTARLVEGWDAQTSTSVVSIELLASVQADSFGASPALDVPSEQVPIDPPVPPGTAEPST